MLILQKPNHLKKYLKAFISSVKQMKFTISRCSFQDGFDSTHPWCLLHYTKAHDSLISTSWTEQIKIVRCIWGEGGGLEPCAPL